MGLVYDSESDRADHEDDFIPKMVPLYTARATKQGRKKWLISVSGISGSFESTSASVSAVEDYLAKVLDVSPESFKVQLDRDFIGLGSTRVGQ